MMNLNLKEKAKLHLSKNWKVVATDTVRELGMDGAIKHFTKQLNYYKGNPAYERSWIHISVNEMIIEYIVNEIGE